MPPSRIEKLTVRHFKSINGTLDIALNKKNLVVLGENGSGKTTLTRALSAVLDASRRSSDGERARLFERCIDADAASAPGFIRLELEGGSAFTLHEDGRWDVMGGRAALPPSLAEAAKAKRVLDYKALLRTYFLHGTPVDLFELLLEDVLPNEENTVSGRTYGEDWAELKRLHDLKPRDRAVGRALDTVIGQLNSGLELKLASVVRRAAPLLAAFDARLSFDITFGALVRSRRTEAVPSGYARLQVLRDSTAIDRHTDFLNEARLSAVALCLHFAVLLDAPRTALGVLVLDDVLIGLDMDNREPILKLVQNHFSDWQIVMLTYDSVWFAKMRRLLGDRDWFCWELRRRGERLDNTRLVNKSKGYMGDVQRLLDDGEIPSAANAARSCLESVFKRYFDEKPVEMTYKIDGKYLGMEDFFKAAWKINENGTRKITGDVERRLKATQQLLNGLSHSSDYPASRTDVEAAIESIVEVAKLLGVRNP